MYKLVIMCLMFLIISFPCFANYGRVCLEKSTGKLIEFQSDNALLGTLTLNAINGGYDENNIEEKYVTKNQWKVLEKKWIIDPADKVKKEMEKIRKGKEDKIKTKLNLSNEDWKNLKDALK